MQIINAADYGIPQRRKSNYSWTKSGEKFVFPKPTHNENSDGLKKYK